MMVRMENKETNIAFIDGQNLHLGTREHGWSVSHQRLRIYLSENIISLKRIISWFRFQ